MAKVDYTGTIPYRVLEHIKGVNLSHIIRDRGPLSLGTALVISKQVQGGQCWLDYHLGARGQDSCSIHRFQKARGKEEG